MPVPGFLLGLFLVLGLLLVFGLLIVLDYQTYDLTHGIPP
jgi:hypothetical protein